MQNKEKLRELIEKLVGEKIQVSCERFNELIFFENGAFVGYSQFNEILLLLGFDRITKSFFQFLVDQTLEYKDCSSIMSLDQLERGVIEFQKLAILLYANIKYGFKILARDAEELEYQFKTFSPIDVNLYVNRHKPILNIENIEPSDTYLLGYKIRDKINDALSKDPEDSIYKPLDVKRLKIIEIGKRNHTAYLTSDHLDVYVATSMRLRHEFIFVKKTIIQLESHENLRSLSLRFFDPTQAFCDSRIDKGLAEALMLKRAKCTVYLAQESDTLGKDSELASTLAQGKPVIALVPEGNKEYVDGQIKLFEEAYPSYDRKGIIIELLKVFDPSLAWTKEKDGESIRGYLNGAIDLSEDQLKEILYQKVEKHYNDRYRTLVKSHPLGIQVDLDTGVATGVLVVRDIDTCADLIKSHVLKSVEYNISEESEEGEIFTYLREKQSGCIYRAVTKDPILTNAYWNFYLNEPNE